MRSPSATAILLMTPFLTTLGIGLPAYAQHDRHEGGHGEAPHGGPPAGQRPEGAMRGSPPPAAAPTPQPRPQPRPEPPRAQQARPEPPRPQPRPENAAGHPQVRPEPRGYAPPRRAPSEARSWHEGHGWHQSGAWSQHGSWQEHRSTNWQNDHRTWAQRGGYGGAYIPADRFRHHFGGQHVFRLHTRPIIENGYPRFQYGGYSFLIVDPWPSAWADTWYDTDDVFIEYDSDGYYLHDRRNPEIAIALTVIP